MLVARTIEIRGGVPMHTGSTDLSTANSSGIGATVACGVRRRLAAVLLAAGAGAVAMALTGCGAGMVTPTAVAGQSVSGRSFGGLQPVANALVQLYAPGTNGYGSASTPLLNRVVTTDSSGNFQIGATDFACPSSSTPIYMLVSGGNPGLGSGANNPALALIGLLGPCGSIGSNGFIVVNEMTTVAAVWSLAPFMVDAAHVGVSPTNVQGLLNAFATSENLVTVYGGRAPGGAPAVASVPVSELNTLGDVLSACVNTNGSTSPTAACGRLFTAATPPGGVAPSDTATAALDIARNPSHNVGSVFSISSSSGPYQPTLTYAPSDWTVSINYSSTAFSTPSDLAIDSQGDVWVSAKPASSNSSVVTILSASGIVANFPQSGMNLGRVAIDPYDDPWLSNSNSSNILELTGSGTRATLNPFSGGGIQGPGPLAFDGYGNVWIGNSGSTVSKLSANGANLSPSTGYATGGAGAPAALALDPSGNVWIADAGGNDIAVLSNNGTAIAGSPYTGGGLNGPFALAIDSTGGAWVANRTGSSLSRFASTGDPIAGSPYYGAGLNAPVALALDGLGNVWLVNSGSNSVSEFLSSGRPQSGAAGYGSSSMSNPFRLAIDRSGSVWVANLGSTTTGASTVTELVGVAAPVVTPMSLAIQNNALNQRP